MSERRVDVAKIERVRSTFDKIERKVTLKDAIRDLYPDIKKLLDSGQVPAKAIHEHLNKQLGASPSTIKSYLEDISAEEEAPKERATATHHAPPVKAGSARKKSGAAKKSGKKRH